MTIIFWIICTNDTHGQVLISTIDLCLRSASQSIGILLTIPWTLHRQLGLIFDRCTWVGRHSVDYQLTVDQVIINHVSTAYQPGCRLSTKWDIDQGYWSSTQLWVPLIHMIPCFIAHMSSHLFSMTNYTGLERTEQAYMYSVLTRGSLKGKLSKPSLRSLFIHTGENSY